MAALTQPVDDTLTITHPSPVKDVAFTAQEATQPLADDISGLVPKFATPTDSVTLSSPTVTTFYDLTVVEIGVLNDSIDPSKGSNNPAISLPDSFTATDGSAVYAIGLTIAESSLSIADAQTFTGSQNYAILIQTITPIWPFFLGDQSAGDGVDVPDAITPLQGFGLTKVLSDSVISSDSISVPIVLNIPDDLVIADSSPGTTFVFQISTPIDDVITLSDQQTPVVASEINLTLDIPDTLIPVDAFSKSADYQPSLSETLAMSDFPSRSFNSGISFVQDDFVSMTDSIASISAVAQINLQKSLSDSVSIFDLVYHRLRFRRH